MLFILAALFKGEGQGQGIDEVLGSGGGEGILDGGEGLDANREGEECRGGGRGGGGGGRAGAFVMFATFFIEEEERLGKP